VADLLDLFEFLPRWRVDDVMISYCAPLGSVGPHSDNYDVFLLQAGGPKRWAISSDPKYDPDNEVHYHLFRTTISPSLFPVDANVGPG
jgi:50S ribosomal protein L16 3-hydroxylase